jgi:hypothetical protein
MHVWLQRFVAFFGSLDWLLNLVGIGAYLGSLALLLREWLRYRRLRRLKELQPSEGAIALAVGIGISVTEDARHYLEESFGRNPDNTPKVPLLLTYDRLGFFSREELIDIMREIRNKIRELMTIGGVREVHLFYGGPIAVAAALGAIVDNWVPVKWYAHNKSTGEYEYLFTLDVETVKGL